MLRILCSIMSIPTYSRDDTVPGLKANGLRESFFSLAPLGERAGSSVETLVNRTITDPAVSLGEEP